MLPGPITNYNNNLSINNTNTSLNNGLTGGFIFLGSLFLFLTTIVLFLFKFKKEKFASNNRPLIEMRCNNVDGGIYNVVQNTNEDIESSNLDSVNISSNESSQVQNNNHEESSFDSSDNLDINQEVGS